MIFDEIPFELKQYIFTYVTPNAWMNTAKVSNEWMELTLGSIRKIESCHALILDHLAEFINQQKNTKYTWLSLVTMMSNLEHLECEEAFVKQMNPIGHQLNVSSCTPRQIECLDWNKLDITCKNLVELLWEGIHEDEGQAFAPNWFAYLPKLEKLTLKGVEINVEWRNKIPKSVKHIFFHTVKFCNISIDELCEDSTALESFSAVSSSITISAASQFFDKTPNLKNLELEFINTKYDTSMILENSLRKCPALEKVNAFHLIITTNWQKLIPENVKSVGFLKMEVEEDIRSSLSFDWLFKNYAYLQSLQVKRQSWSGFDSQKFCSTKNLKELSLDSASLAKLRDDDTIDPFSDICFRMIRDSHLVHVEISGMTINKSWMHIFPPTVKRLGLDDFQLSKEAKDVFSPQFLCEDPSNIELLSLAVNFKVELPAMSLNAFNGMNKLERLRLSYCSISGECLQSILTHCFALEELSIRELQSGAFTIIPRNLVLLSLRKLHVKKPVDQPSLLLQHFPKVCTVKIALLPPETSFSDVMQAMEGVETVDIKIRGVTWPLLRSLVESIDDTKFQYFCLSRSFGQKLSFYLTNSLPNACLKLRNLLIYGANDVLWINNYPTSPLLRKHGSKIPSSMDELLQRYCKLMASSDED